MCSWNPHSSWTCHDSNDLCEAWNYFLKASETPRPSLYIKDLANMYGKYVWQIFMRFLLIVNFKLPLGLSYKNAEEQQMSFF